MSRTIVTVLILVIALLPTSVRAQGTSVESNKEECKAKGECRSPQDEVDSWRNWHNSIEKALAERFTAMCPETMSQGKPLSAVVTYTVAENRHITNVKLLQKSPNFIFNVLVLRIVNSMNDNDVFQFPNGYRGPDINKAATFSCGADRWSGIILAK
jgi:hypothetical protein